MNPRPLGPQPSALPAELHPPYAPEGIRTPDPRLRRPLLYPPELLALSAGRKSGALHLERDCHAPWFFLFQSGRADLNGRPPAPKAGALPGCATPRSLRSGESINTTRLGSASGLTPERFIQERSAPNDWQMQPLEPSKGPGRRSSHSTRPGETRCEDRESPLLRSPVAHRGTWF